MDPAFEQEHLGNFSQMQILVILPNGGCRLRPCYMLSKTEIFFIARLVKIWKYSKHFVILYPK